ncbi:hypothetical protein ZOSMA_3G01350 [Zostera marina]|uniref:PWWP domain-containing protein n=1 Tax=Zostera marina TaxID=29655 RepID=A0A0K9P3U9_ZOSMR|nr:hypothetical protein ZOSMA_3G01350 [Zostera marina]
MESDAIDLNAGNDPWEEAPAVGTDGFGEGNAGIHYSDGAEKDVTMDGAAGCDLIEEMCESHVVDHDVCGFEDNDVLTGVDNSSAGDVHEGKSSEKKDFSCSIESVEQGDDASHCEHVRNGNQEQLRAPMTGYAHMFLQDGNSDKFSISDLVWGKIKSHPWWPGVIVDPLNASEMALKHQRKDNFLIAYFGDKTFAWCDDSQLKPFCKFFTQMEMQSSSEVFRDAVYDALDEVSRRLHLEMVHSLKVDKSFSKPNDQPIENAGIRVGVSISVPSMQLNFSSFQPKNFHSYICTLAKFPTRNFDRLDLTITQAQLMTFYHSKGCTTRGAFFSDHETTECGDRANSFVDSAQHSVAVLVNGKKRGRPKKNLPEKKQKSLPELLEDDNDNHLFDDFERDFNIRVSHQSAVHHGDLNSKQPSPLLSKTFKLGECIRRVATKLISSSPVSDCNGEVAQKGAVMKIDCENDSPFSLDASPSSSSSKERETIIKSRIVESFGSLNVSEMLFQLCSAARKSTEDFYLLPTTITFFTEIQKLRSSISTESLHTITRRRGRPKILRGYSPSEEVKLSDKVGPKRGRPSKSIPNPIIIEDREIPDKVARKRGRPRKVPVSSGFLSEFPTVSTLDGPGPDHMKDSYWTDMVVHTNPEKKRRGRKRKEESQLQNPRRKSKSAVEHSEFLPQRPLPGVINTGKSTGLASGRQIKYFGRKCLNESIPTAVVLTFSTSECVPLKKDLMRIFSRYGPLKDAEVSMEIKCATVLFKRQADAEVAFSSACKCSFFGPGLLSYRLKKLSSISMKSPHPVSVDQMDCTQVQSVNHDDSNCMEIEESEGIKDHSVACQGESSLKVVELVTDDAIPDDEPTNHGGVEVPAKNNRELIEICSTDIPVIEEDLLPSSDDANLNVLYNKPHEALIDSRGMELERHGVDETPAAYGNLHTVDFRHIEVSMDIIPEEEPTNHGGIEVPARNSRDELMEICSADIPVTEEDLLPLSDNVNLNISYNKPNEAPADVYGMELERHGVDETPAAYGNLDTLDFRHIEVSGDINPEEEPTNHDGIEVPVKNSHDELMEICSADISVTGEDLLPLSDGANLNVSYNNSHENPADACGMELERHRVDESHETPAVDKSLDILDSKHDEEVIKSGYVVGDCYSETPSCILARNEIQHTEVSDPPISEKDVSSLLNQCSSK